MTAIFTLLGLSFGGLSIVARIKAALAWLALSAALVAIAGGVGAWKGYEWRGAVEAARAAKIAADVKVQDEARQLAADEAARLEAERAAQQEGQHDAVSNDLLAPRAGDDGACGSIGAEWLRGLGSLE